MRFWKLFCCCWPKINTKDRLALYEFEIEQADFKDFSSDLEHVCYGEEYEYSSSTNTFLRKHL